jgi:hypothetical protein
VTSDSAVDPDQTRPRFPHVATAYLGVVAAAAVALLALVETAVALIAPSRAPTDADWNRAATQIRTEFRSGDLIVAAPAWADPVMRLHVGDLLPVAVAARMDDARFGRIWEISQRGAHADGIDGFAATSEYRFGALKVRLVERPAAQVTFDFLEHWREAYVTRWDPATGTAAPCPWQADRFACPISGNTVRRQLVEVDTGIRRAILAPPVMAAIVAVEFQSVNMGRELVVAAGLHDVWARKSAGTVYFEIWIAGRPVSNAIIGNRSGWRSIHIDTSAYEGQTLPVRFQVSAPRPEARNLAFAAEARR